MSYSIVLTKNHITNLGSGNNRFSYSFTSSQQFKNQSVAISQMSMYYCWQNITAKLNNNQAGYIFPNGSSVITYQVTIPDGNYEINDLNTLLHLHMKNHGLYLINSSHEEVYYINFTLLKSQYKVGLECILLPTSLPSGWSYPSNKGFTLPTTASYPQLVILSGNSFSDIIGFNAGTFPTVSTGTGDYMVTSTG